MIDPIGLLDDADWLISHFDESGGSTGTTVTCDSCTPPRGPTPPVTDGSASVTRISVTNPTITTTVTENVGATANLVDTSNFFVRSDILSGTFARDQLTGLTNGFGIPASRALEVGRTFVGPEGNFAESGGIGQYVRLRAYDPQLGLRVQARFDVGFVQGFGNVDRVVLETYDPVAQILLKVHLPLI